MRRTVATDDPVACCVCLSFARLLSDLLYIQLYSPALVEKKVTDIIIIRNAVIVVAVKGTFV